MFARRPKISGPNDKKFLVKINQSVLNFKNSLTPSPVIFCAALVSKITDLSDPDNYLFFDTKVDNKLDDEIEINIFNKKIDSKLFKNLNQRNLKTLIKRSKPINWEQCLKLINENKDELGESTPYGRGPYKPMYFIVK
ncbi:hypothetical protein BIY24_14500 [Halobacteriovorax marinus]|uniref:hypothetical protein n=1 Tax=Halobacteriovorax marinus TaxID=97084 RepID=UPI000BC2DA67|nr:hypothetical protein [Halobacteriovorax marinus]ATH09109.1 hypothetical protein BIY24_14500 [Halobacteriovorax marinus]